MGKKGFCIFIMLLFFMIAVSQQVFAEDHLGFTAGISMMNMYPISAIGLSIETNPLILDLVSFRLIGWFNWLKILNPSGYFTNFLFFTFSEQIMVKMVIDDFVNGYLFAGFLHGVIPATDGYDQKFGYGSIGGIGFEYFISPVSGLCLFAEIAVTYCYDLQYTDDKPMYQSVFFQGGLKFVF